METTNSFLRNFFTLVISSFISALIVISIMAMTSTENKERIDQIKQEISQKRVDLNKARDLLAKMQEKNSPWRPDIKAKIAYFKKIKIPKLQLDIAKLEAELGGIDHNFGNIFIHKCDEYLLSYFFKIFFLLLFFPLILSLIMYYLVAPRIEKIAPIRALKRNNNSENLQLTSVKSALNVRLKNSEHLYIRGDWIGSRVDVKVKTKLMWKWSAPLVTFAADLFELKEYWSENNDTQGEITITTPATDLYIGEINLQNNRAIVIRPRYLVGISDSIKIRTFWNFSLHNILAGKIRQVILYGNGRIFIYGYQGIDTIAATERNYKIESKLLIGYDAHSEYSLCRNETWWHYFRKESDLFDIKINKGIFVKQTTSGIYINPKANWLEKSINFILNGIGSVLGF